MSKKKTVKTTRLAEKLTEKWRKKWKAEDGDVTTRGSQANSHISGFIGVQCFPLEVAIGKPGLPKGRIVTYQGPEQSAKTTSAMHSLAAVQQAGGVPIIIDAEGKFDVDRAAQLGLYDADHLEQRGLTHLEPLIIIFPEHLQDACKKIREMILDIREEDPDVDILIVWDSVAATPTRQEVESDEDNLPGVAARMVSLWFRKLTRTIGKHQAVLLCINQEKEKIGAMAFADKSAARAERALAFHSTIRITFKKIRSFGADKEEPDGIEVIATIKKNQIAPPFRKANFTVWFKGKRQGIDNEQSMIDLAVKWGIVKKSGGGYVSFEGGDKWRLKKWPDVEHHDAIIAALKEEAEERIKRSFMDWDGKSGDEDDDPDSLPDVDDDDEDDDE